VADPVQTPPSTSTLDPDNAVSLGSRPVVREPSKAVQKAPGGGRNAGKDLSESKPAQDRLRAWRDESGNLPCRPAS